MEITWLGQTCFELKNHAAICITDPYNLNDGRSKRTADVVSLSNEALSPMSLIAQSDSLKILSRSGEYEIKGIFIIGRALYSPSSNSSTRRTIVFVYQIDDLRICHLGNLGHVPTQQVLEALDHIDILLMPIGGGSYLNANKAAEVIRIIEPALVIPMQYALIDQETTLDPLEKFLQEMGLSKVEPQSKLRVRANNLPVETQVVVLSSIN